MVILTCPNRRLAKMTSGVFGAVLISRYVGGKFACFPYLHIYYTIFFNKNQVIFIKKVLKK